MKIRIFNAFSADGVVPVMGVEIPQVITADSRDIENNLRETYKLLMKAILVVRLGANLPDMVYEEGYSILKQLQEAGLEVGKYEQLEEFRKLAEERYRQRMEDVWPR